MINPNAILEINSKNLIKNYQTISKYSNKSITGAVIKANAYGLGDKKIFDLLYKNVIHLYHYNESDALLVSNPAISSQKY